jgi:ferredoxin
MNKLQEIVSALFSNDQITLVIGYEKGTGDKRRPAFVTSAEDASRLVFDEHCSHNLSVYLTKPEIRSNTRIAVFTTPYTMRAILRLAGENQFHGRNFSFIVNHGEEPLVINSMDALVAHAGEQKLSVASEPDDMVATIHRMSREERFAWWKEQLSDCIKCYACRAACPMCYCSRCTVEVNQPQWISVPSTLQGNFEYHIMRAMHMAGRCVDCGSCEAACPVGIPLNAITRRMAMDIEAALGPDIISADAKNVLNTFQPDDKENFIR